MSDPQESISVVTRREGTTAVIELAGELDLHSSAELSAAVDQVLAGAPADVEIDAQGLSFADSAGLRTLLQAREEAAARGVGLRLSRVSDPLGRLLEMTGLREILGVPTS
ncbi:MAG TPA: STAS domain-containing protein [Acidimicrobiales bacterium]|nr:STAS domain-containing protein [Acidimicrobiales bacterium]